MRRFHVAVDVVVQRMVAIDSLLNLDTGVARLSGESYRFRPTFSIARFTAPITVSSTSSVYGPGFP